jgi:uncharacterized membrane protein HdeD (DUF308 family)
MISPDTIGTLTQVNQTIPQLLQLATALAYIYGMYMVVISVAALRNCAHLGQVAQGQETLSGVFKKVFLGTALLYLPSTIQVGASTFWTETSPIAYINVANDQYIELILAAYSIIYLLGTLSVIRGIIELAYGNGKDTEQGHQGPLHKGLAHIIGGIFCMNIHLVATTIMPMLGTNLY